jgi:hypothetical protein
MGKDTELVECNCLVLGVSLCWRKKEKDILLFQIFQLAYLSAHVVFFPGKEHALLICNHKSDIDWLLGWVVAQVHDLYCATLITCVPHTCMQCTFICCGFNCVSAH